MLCQTWSWLSRIVLTLIVAGLNFQIICESVVVHVICSLNMVFWTEIENCSSPVLYDTLQQSFYFTFQKMSYNDMMANTVKFMSCKLYFIYDMK